MAILLIKIDNVGSLPLNEFYDYNGSCYALSRSRQSGETVCMDLLDFYDAAPGVSCVEDVPVFFVAGQDSYQVLGWYKKAKIWDMSRQPSFFLEGNVVADAADAVMLPESFVSSDRGLRIQAALGQKYYEVVEAEDERYDQLLQLMKGYSGKNAFMRYPYTHVVLDSLAVRSYDLCIDYCMELGQKVMADQCTNIRDIKLMELYAKQAASLNRRDPDGFYYLAMASYQLGFVKQGLKAIGKALELEPDAADLLAQKAFLLVSRGYVAEGAATFHQAFDQSGEEDYLLWEGKTHLLGGQMELGYDCFKKITDKKLLEDAGIVLKDMEKKWPFINIRGIRLRDIFRRK